MKRNIKGIEIPKGSKVKGPLKIEGKSYGREERASNKARQKNK